MVLLMNYVNEKGKSTITVLKNMEEVNIDKSGPYLTITGEIRRSIDTTEKIKFVDVTKSLIYKDDVVIVNEYIEEKGISKIVRI